MNGVNDEIFYETEGGSSTILYAEGIGLDELSTQNRTEYEIDFKALIDE